MSWHFTDEYTIDIQRDRHREFFELPMPEHSRSTFDVSVLQTDTMRNVAFID